MNINSEDILYEINKLLKEFYRVKSLDDYRVKMASFFVLSDVYTSLTDEELEINAPYLSYYLEKYSNVPSYIDELLNEYFNNQKEHNSLSGKVLSTYNRSDFTNYKLEDTSRRLPKTKQIELINEFLDDFNPNMAKVFNYLFMNNLIEESSAYEENVTYVYHAKTKPYVMVGKLENVFDIDVLLHELGHAYSFKKLENRSKKQIIKFTRHYYEMYSLYVELAFQKFLKDNHMYVRDAYICENAYYSYFESYARNFKQCNRYNRDNCFADYSIDNIEQSFIYFYGHYIALRVFENSLKDKEGIEEALEDFLSYQGLLTYDEQLKMFGLNRDNLKDMKVLKKNLDTHNTEIKNYIK